MKKYLYLIGLTFLSFGLSAAESELNVINRAGEQRMLAERVVKSYAQIGLNVLPIAAKNELDGAISRFEKNLEVIEASASNSSIKELLWDLKTVWQPLKKALHGVPRRENALYLSSLAEQVVLSADRLIKKLQNYAPVAAGRLVALSGRQRMLSQRLTKAYLLISWGEDSGAMWEELDSTVNEFNGALTSLKSREENTEEIIRELDDMTLQWEWLQTALQTEGASNYRLIVAEASESILQSADRLAGLYERLPKR